MKLKRRSFLWFLAEGADVMPALMTSSYTRVNLLIRRKKFSSMLFIDSEPQIPTLPDSFFVFPAIKGSILLETLDVVPQPIEAYSIYEVVDDLWLPKDFTNEVIAAWGNKLLAKCNRQISLFKQQYKNLGDLYCGRY